MSYRRPILRLTILFALLFSCLSPATRPAAAQSLGLLAVGAAAAVILGRRIGRR